MRWSSRQSKLQILQTHLGMLRLVPGVSMSGVFVDTQNVGKGGQEGDGQRSVQSLEKVTGKDKGRQDEETRTSVLWALFYFYSSNTTFKKKILVLSGLWKVVCFFLLCVPSCI